jgi:isopenicillin N synthase-like dioxygenase
MLPLVDLSTFLSGHDASSECRNVSRAFEEYGALFIRDPRVSQSENEDFLDLLERYFDRPEQIKRRDSHPELMYQVGYTPPFTERPRDHTKRTAAMEVSRRPNAVVGADPKARFYWRVGPRPPETRFPELNAENVIPADFPDWSARMDRWGRLMLDAALTVAEMTAIGFGLERTFFTRLMRQAPHLLDPTGVDLDRHGELGTVCAGFHYDLNFLSLHGRVRFPGLVVWSRDEAKIDADVPPGCLLVQAGRELEYMTGGRVLNGFHEVAVSAATQAAIQEAARRGRSLWRVTSTFFAHIDLDAVLSPPDELASRGARTAYPPLYAGDLVKEELVAIGLDRRAGATA